jgi:hypothetical protein
VSVEKTVNTIDVSQSKMDAYFDVVNKHIQTLQNDPTMTVKPEFTQALIADTLTFIRDNEIMFSPSKVEKYSRFKSVLYNDLIDWARIDLEVAFARLRALVKVINVTSNIINAKTYSILSEIDEILDRVSNLSNLKNTFNQYDEIIYNTFIDDINKHDDIGYKTNHGDSGGIITLKDILTDNVVEKDSNFDLFMEPLNKNTVARQFRNTPTNDNMSFGLDASIYAFEPLSISDYEIALEEDGNTVSKVNFNGSTAAVIIRFPSIKLINHIEMKFASSGLTEVVGVYYSEDQGDTVDSVNWTAINFTIDNNNIRGVDINFESKEAGSIMFILGQKLFKEIIVEKNRGLETLIQDEEFELSKFLNQIEKNANIVTKGKIKEYATPDVVKSLSDDTAKITNAILEQLEIMLPPEERHTDITDTIEYNSINEYNFAVYDFKVNYVHYFNNSTFKSDAYGGDGSIANILLTANGNEPSLNGDVVSKDTTVNYYIELENGQHRIIPHNQDTIKDIVTITSPGSGQSINIDLLAKNDNSLKVYVNNSLTSEYSPIVQYAGADIAFGITMSGSVNLNFGDTVIVEYTAPELDTAGKELNIYEIDIDEVLGNPAIINTKLNKGEPLYAIVTMNDSSYVSYRIPDEIHKIKKPAEDGDLTEDFTYNIVSGLTKVSESNLPSGWASGTISGDYIVPSESVKITTKTIYNGVLNEEIDIISGATTFNTQTDYLHGSLHVSSQGKPIFTNEYNLDTEATKNDKTYFDTSGVSYVDKLNVSYIPVDPTSIETESNISAHNYSEVFQGTDDDASITLPFNPHLDINIIGNSGQPGSEWISSRGTFVNKFDEEVTYQPIVVTIEGKKVENLTDYFTGVIPTFNLYRDVEKNYQYYVVGNKVVFNTNIKGRLINVSFYKQNDKFKLVSKLYRTNRKIDDITPEVYGYAIYINKRE